MNRIVGLLLGVRVAPDSRLYLDVEWGSVESTYASKVLEVLEVLEGKGRSLEHIEHLENLEHLRLGTGMTKPST